jgi:hypothetical protein
MSCCRLGRTLLILAAAGLGVGAALAAVVPEVRDEGKFFSPETVKKADEQIREIYRKHGLDVVVETYKTVPGEDVEKLKAMDNRARGEFFLKYAKERAKERVVNGIYVIVTREPRHLLVGITGRGERSFSREFRSKAERAMIDEFMKGRFDDGLLALVKMADEQLSKSGK